MGKKRALIAYGVDVDAISGWLGSYGGEDSVSDISQGYYAGTQGTLRMLKLFSKYDIKATWFVPGHSLETFPDEMAAVRDAGHELGLHGYSHENPQKMSPKQQRDVLEKSYKLLTEFQNGKPPRGSVTPWWEVSSEGVDLLLEYGIEYDHSLADHDCQCFYTRTGDSWTKIDYGGGGGKGKGKGKGKGEGEGEGEGEEEEETKAESWMKPFVRGAESGLVQIPGTWYVDDLPPMMFIKSAANSHGFVNPRDVEDIWRDTFDYYYREYDEFVFPITCHPDVSGRPHVLLMQERLIQHFMKHEGVEFVTMGQVCDEFKSKNPIPKGAKMPADPKEVAKKLGLHCSL